MLSYWILLYLIFSGCLCGNRSSNSCGCSSACGRTEKKPDCKRPSYSADSCNQRETSNDNNAFIQPRPFNGFTVQNTCGCENTNE